MVIPGYEITEEVSTSGCFVLSRGKRLEDNRPVLLKHPHRVPAAIADLRLLENEHSLLSEFKMPGIPRVYELLRFDGTSCLVLEDSRGAPLLEVMRPLPVRDGSVPEERRRRESRSTPQVELSGFFKVAIRLAAILVELHKREIVHRNINSNGILVHAESGRVCLMDLHFARRSTSETRESAPQQLLRGALAYLSPEQTGRMNRSVDYRTDFYSLGVTFYEILAGRLPFSSDDPLEMIHSHIARTPPSVVEVRGEVPEALSQIVMKLLAKTAEERYQSAAGLREDLEFCAREWESSGRISAFTLGERDVSDRFLIPQRLYGREPEVAKLLDAFHYVCGAQTAMMVVGGYSGIGKTSLIQELYKPIVRERGYFVSGKFDQVARSVPFGALIQAFRGLALQLLAENEERLAFWRSRLSEALGANGGVISEVIPEIELITGKQPSPPALGPTEALNRFQLVFQNFVGALARAEHPLVVFLDDLQWADPATLSLLQPLLGSPGIRYFFLIGAYRDNEVDVAHPLVQTLTALESAGVELRRITLSSLQLTDLTRFIGDTLRADPDEAAPLADLVWKKTDGNPFFVIQFLKSLKQEGFLAFDYTRARWTYRIEDIANAAITDNVIDLMTTKIRRLSSRTQRALALASCIGNPFDRKTLGIVSERSPESADEDLQEAIAEGLILLCSPGYEPADDRELETAPPTAGAYAFLHDRVQQAAYALIPPGQKQTVHLAVGRLLLERAEPAEIEERIFDVVQHLNIGGALIDDDGERLTLARLNLNAGRKAKSSTAYEAALGYLKQGLSLLDEEAWNSHYDLVYALNIEAAECQNLCGNFEDAEREFELLLQRAATSLDRARVFGLRIVHYEKLSRYRDALASAHEGLALFGVSFPKSSAEKQAALEREIKASQSLLGSRSIDSLVDLPVMTDPEIRMVMNILTTIWSVAYISGDQPLTRLISATMVRLSLVHGNSEASAYGYATHAITVGPLREDYKAAYEFGSLAVRVNERFNDARLRAKIYQQFHAHALLWRRPLRDCIAYAREASRSGFETGDFTYAIYGAYTETWVAIVVTQDLAQFERNYSPNLELFKKLKVASVGDGQKVLLNWARALRGETIAPTSLSDAEFDENEYVRQYRDNPFFLICYAVAKMHLCYVFGKHGKALEASRVGREIVHHLEGTIWIVTFEFWNGLTLAASFASAGDEEKMAYIEELKKARRSLAILAENCAENYLCQSLLLSAEIERIEGRELETLDLYKRAADYARETSMIQYQALSAELCARFWLGRQQPRVASAFLTEARECYAKWGAAAKVVQIERDYSDLLTGEKDSRRSEPLEPGAGSLDVATVTKAARAIAAEIELEDLLRKLMEISLENAAAERGLFLQEKDGQLLIEAEGAVGQKARVRQSVPLEKALNLSHAIVRYVRNSGESVVINEAVTDERFAGDPYILASKPKSILCVPIVHQGRSSGILYLENNLTTGAFTSDRIEIMRILSGTAAITLGKANLYEAMRQEAASRRRAEETMREIVKGTASVTGEEFFRALARHLASAIGVRYAFATECADRTKTRLRTLAFWTGSGFADNTEYDVALTPCKKVTEGEVCHYASELQRLFPGDTDLAGLNAESYVGLPLIDSFGELIGHLAVIDDKPMPDASGAMSVLKIFAARAAAELQRQQAEEELRKALQQVEQLKNRLHAENLYLQEEIREQHNFEEIVGNSAPLLELLREAERVAPTDSSVLIYGETGTGKELIARAIHNRSSRKDRPLVKVNCGAISAGLVESELFGHVKGAFTGAFERRTGRFELANGGTLFLDEVGELPPETQVKLLRVLQEGEFEPVGSSRTVRVDVRIIAATNRSLGEAVGEGRFRSDLYYRLNVFPLTVPPLRERKSDIPQLAMFFLSRYAKKFAKQVEGISQETVDLFMQYAWPGNIRELQNLMERAVVLSQGRVVSMSRDLFPSAGFSSDVRTATVASGSAVSSLSSGTLVQPEASRAELSGSLSLEEIERRHILAVLEDSAWVIEGPRGAARTLNLHPNTLRGRMKKLGIQRPRAWGGS